MSGENDLSNESGRPEESGRPHSLDLQPVTLRELDETLLDQLVEVAKNDADPQEVFRPLPGQEGWSDQQLEAFREFHHKRMSGVPGEPGAELSLAIAEDGLIGCARMRRIDSETFDIGLWLARPARGRKLGRRAIRELMVFAREAGARRLVAETTIENLAAVVLLAGAGGSISTGRGGAVVALIDLYREPGEGESGQPGSARLSLS